MSEPKLKGVIRNYLSDTELKETLHDQKLDVGFRFLFPKGKNPQGVPVGKPFSVIKAKNRKYLEISSSVNLDGKPLKTWIEMEINKRRDLVNDFI